MAGEASTPSSSEKPYGITNIKAFVPLTLDLEELNYDSWRELFETHCISFGVLGHVDGSSRPTSATDTEWRKLDSLVKLWIYGTISKPLLQMILKKGVTSHDVWQSLENLFRDNKDARAIQLDNDLRNIVLGDLSITEYCQRIKGMSDLLANIDAPVAEKNLVTYMINGLSDKFEHIAGIIRHRTPLPSFLQARSMLLLEEQRLARPRNHHSTHLDHSSSPTVLHTGNSATSSPNPRRNYDRRNDNRGDRRQGRRNDGRGERRSHQPRNSPSAGFPAHSWGLYGWPTPSPWAAVRPPLPNPSSAPQQRRRGATGDGLLGSMPPQAFNTSAAPIPPPW